MSEEQLKAFLNALEADKGLQAKTKAAVEGEIDTPDEIAAVLAIAKEAGFAITAADLLRNEAQNILELSDEELEGVAGGRGRFQIIGRRHLAIAAERLHGMVDRPQLLDLTHIHPCHHKGFYLSKHPQKPENSIRYLAPSPTYSTNLEPLFTTK